MKITAACAILLVVVAVVRAEPNKIKALPQEPSTGGKTAVQLYMPNVALGRIRSKRDKLDLILKATRLLGTVIPVVGNIVKIIDFFKTHLWDAPSAKEDLMYYVDQKIGEMHQKIDETRLEETQRILGRSFYRYDSLYKSLLKNPGDENVQFAAVSEQHEIRAACDRLISQFETMRETRKFALVHASVSAVVCLSATSNYIANLTVLHKPSSIEELKENLFQQMIAYVSKFSELGKSIFKEWKEWRQDSIVIEYHRYWEFECFCIKTYASVNDKATASKDHQLSETCNEFHKDRVQSCAEAKKKEWYESAMGQYRKFYKVMKPDQLKRFLNITEVMGRENYDKHQRVLEQIDQGNDLHIAGRILIPCICLAVIIAALAWIARKHLPAPTHMLFVNEPDAYVSTEAKRER